jgi:hypothetical protein
MSLLNVKGAICAAIALTCHGSALAQQAAAGDASLNAAREFDAVNRSIRVLWSSHRCFRTPNSQTHDSIRRCWAKNPLDAVNAQDRTGELIDRLDAIRDAFPSTIVILQTKLNLMTRVAMFCEEAELPPEDVDILSTRSSAFREWASSLRMCATETADAKLYGRLRGALEKNLASYDHITRVYLLRLWFNSFLFQYAANGDLTKVADALNAEGVGPWKTFVVFLRKDASSFSSFPESSVSVEELDEARRALDAA